MDVLLPRLFLLALLSLVAWLLFGCASAAGPAVVTVEVPVPVPCEAPGVARPAMPTEALALDADVFVVARALWAELEVRDGYEGRLVAALEGCKKRAP